MKLMSVFSTRFLLLISFTCISLHGLSQLFPEKNYPQQYFQWPVHAKVALAANFGELRPNHYHMGLDCKTDQAVNKPVLAAAEGYVSRVKIEPWGFGRSISINHPNGITSLYAHLNDFYPELEKYVKEQQYAQKRWDVTLYFPAGMFKLQKGAFLAYSGNTGGSQGPHLHFELRDTRTDKVLNPLLFGFPVPDKVAPDILRLAVYDRCYSTYEQSPRIYQMNRTATGVYGIAAPVTVTTDKVSFAISGYDRYSGSSNPNGIYKAVMLVDGKAVSGFEMDSISYDETRFMNAHIDYSTKSRGGPYLQHLSELPGYKGGIYKTDGSNGVISLNDDNNHSVSIVVTDTDGNKSTLNFIVKRNGIKPVNRIPENTLPFHPGNINIFENSKLKFYLPENCLYDSFNFRYKETVAADGNTIHQVHNTSVPLQTYFTLNIKADFPLKDTGKVIMKRFAGTKENYKKAVFRNGWYSASFREFGNFVLLIDNNPPVITAAGFYSGIDASRLRSIRFTVKDDMEDLKNFTALLDGNWICFSNDKGSNFIYEFDEHCSPGNHELKISVEDLAGNKTEKVYQFKR